jgi:hypothetical protein
MEWLVEWASQILSEKRLNVLVRHPPNLPSP